MRRGRRAAFLLVPLAVASVAATARAAGPVPALPAPRINSLSARTLPVGERIVSLTPRVISVAPKRTGANTFAVGTDVLFAFDSSKLSAAARAVLGGVIAKLQHAHAGTVTIDGYTDSIGTAAYNRGLSERRAGAVQRFLRSSVANTVLGWRARGFGASHFVAPNTNPDGSDNPDGRRQNRRVVISYRSG